MPGSIDVEVGSGGPEQFNSFAGLVSAKHSALSQNSFVKSSGK